MDTYTDSSNLTTFDALSVITTSLMLQPVIDITHHTINNNNDHNNNNNNNNTNMTREDIVEYLEMLQKEEFLVFIPVVIFLITIAVIGFFGNTLVLLVYKYRFPKTPKRIFIMAIAVFDLIANVIAIPTDVHRMSHLWDFTQSGFCRLGRFATSSTFIISGYFLLGLAIDRYLKICRPFGKQLTTRHAKIMVIGLTLLGWSSPTLYVIVSGSQSRPTPRPGVIGHKCDVHDAYVGTVWPLAANGIFFLLFVSTFIPLVVIYILIGIQVFKHRNIFKTGPIKPKGQLGSCKTSTVTILLTREWTSKLKGVKQSDVSTVCDSERERKDADICCISPKEVDSDCVMAASPNTNTQSSADDKSDSTIDGSTDDIFKSETEVVDETKARPTNTRRRNGSSNEKRVKKSDSLKHVQRGSLNRTTIMLIVITSLFVLSFVPYMAVTFFRFTQPDKFKALGKPSLVMCYILLRSFSVNCAANAIIYSFCDYRFRKESLKFLRCNA